MIERHEKLLGINFVRQNKKIATKPNAGEPTNKSLNIQVRGTNKFVAGPSQSAIGISVLNREKPIPVQPNNPNPIT